MDHFQPGQHRQHRQHRQHGPHRPAPGSPRVLLAGAEGPERQAFLRALRRGWLEVTTVEHGAAALDALRGGTYDLAVLDADLPGLAGTAVCRWVREHGTDRALPLVLLVRDDEEGVARAAGASLTLAAGVPPRLLRNRVAALLRHAEVPLPRPRAGAVRALPFLRVPGASRS